MSAPSLYVNLQLDPSTHDIRLLDILPAQSKDETSGDAIQCKLRRVDLDSEPQFQALSYVWGDEKLRNDVCVNGLAMSVTASLESALRHLQDPQHIVTIWTDALCINQGDKVEKGHQVRRMHDMYSKAQRTIVWLGPEDGGSSMAMKALEDTGSRAKQHGAIDYEASAISSMIMEGDPALRGLIDMVEAIGWSYPFKAVHNLLLRPYWSRFWVMQEFAVASEVTLQCGYDTLAGDDFAAAYLFKPLLQRHLIANYTDADLLIDMQASKDYEVGVHEPSEIPGRLGHMMRNAGSPRPGGLLGTRKGYSLWQQDASMTSERRLCHLLERTNAEQGEDHVGLGVKEPKDRIFGLLGMLGSGVTIGFAVDYGLSDEDVYRDATHWLLCGGQMALLCYAQIHGQVRLPTWCPDWRNRLREPNMEKGLFKPSGAATGFATAIDADTLRLKGVMLGTVSHVDGFWQAENYGSTTPWEEAGRFIHEVQALVEAQDDVPSMLGHMSKEQWQEGAWRIPTADQYTDEIGMRVRAPAAAKTGWETLKQGQSVLLSQPPGLNPLNQYQIAMSRLHARRLARNEDGLIGLLPANVEIGDAICIVVGAEAPLLLRSVVGHSAFQIVGEAYVYGIMDGELVSASTVFSDIDVC